MMILPSCRAQLTPILAILGLCGCSSLVQQPAPIESGGSPPRQVSSQKWPQADHAGKKTNSGAQTAPYQADTPIGGTSPTAKPIARSDGKTHVVAPGENLFRISLANGLKYQQVAAWNNLPDFNIKVGQVLRLTPPAGEQAAASSITSATAASTSRPVGQGGAKIYPKALKLAYSDAAVNAIKLESEGNTQQSTTSKATASASASTSSAPIATPMTAKESSAPSSGESGGTWVWPAKGKVLRGFSDSNKGIDIAGSKGQPVVAANDGKVVYSGSGLRGYGKLIIIKHNKTFLSAYAHNSQLLVKEGQTVKKGQKIAEMGSTDADQVKLHFEIRQFGKPVEPMQYLNSKP